MTETELTTPKLMPTVYRVLVTRQETEGANNIWNNQDRYEVRPATEGAPQDVLADTKRDMSVRNYTRSIGLPEGWTIWEWQEFDGFDFSPKYHVRNAQGEIISLEALYEK